MMAWFCTGFLILYFSLQSITCTLTMYGTIRASNNGGDIPHEKRYLSLFLSFLLPCDNAIKYGLSCLALNVFRLFNNSIAFFAFMFNPSFLFVLKFDQIKGFLTTDCMRFLRFFRFRKWQFLRSCSSYLHWQVVKPHNPRRVFWFQLWNCPFFLTW